MIYRDYDHERTARPKLGTHGSFQRCCLVARPGGAPTPVVAAVGWGLASSAPLCWLISLGDGERGRPSIPGGRAEPTRELGVGAGYPPLTPGSGRPTARIRGGARVIATALPGGLCACGQVCGERRWLFNLRFSRPRPCVVATTAAADRTICCRCNACVAVVARLEPRAGGGAAP
jgi:hypothetical protein